MRFDAQIDCVCWWLLDTWLLAEKGVEFTKVGNTLQGHIFATFCWNAHTKANAFVNVNIVLVHIWSCCDCIHRRLDLRNQSGTMTLVWMQAFRKQYREDFSGGISRLCITKLFLFEWRPEHSKSLFKSGIFYRHASKQVFWNSCGGADKIFQISVNMPNTTLSDQALFSASLFRWQRFSSDRRKNV